MLDDDAGFGNRSAAIHHYGKAAERPQRGVLSRHVRFLEVPVDKGNFIFPQRNQQLLAESREGVGGERQRDLASSIWRHTSAYVQESLEPFAQEGPALAGWIVVQEAEHLVADL